MVNLFTGQDQVVEINYNRVEEGRAAESNWPGQTGSKSQGKKRPSVETEGRLTIACHMKSLKNRFGVFALPYSCSLLIPSVQRMKAVQI